MRPFPLNQQAIRAYTPILRAPCTRYYSTPVKASVKLIAEIRKSIPGTSLVKARDALEATNNQLLDALSWLEKDIVVSGAAKAAKLEGRTTGEGLIAVSVLSSGGWAAKGKNKAMGVRTAMIELNCETDFVARNELFVRLAEDICHTAAFLVEPSAQTASSSIFDYPSIDALSDAPLMSSYLSTPSPSSSSTASQASVSESIRNTIARLGEKVSLRRICTAVTDPLTDPTTGLVLSSYIHSVNKREGTSTHLTQSGRMAALVALGIHSSKLPDIPRKNFVADDLISVGRSLASQVVGFNPQTIRGEGELRESGDPDSTALYDQPMMMRPDGGDYSVQEYLRRWSEKAQLRTSSTQEQAMEEGAEVVQFERWSVGS